jgi:hypothetical protein
MAASINISSIAAASARKQLARVGVAEKRQPAAAAAGESRSITSGANDAAQRRRIISGESAVVARMKSGENGHLARQRQATALARDVSGVRKIDNISGNGAVVYRQRWRAWRSRRGSTSRVQHKRRWRIAA